MGRRKKAGKHRTRTGTGTGYIVDDGGAEIRAALATENTRPGAGSTGEIAEMVGSPHADHQGIAPVENIAQLEAEANAALAAAPVEPALSPAPAPVPEYDPNAPTEWDMYMQIAVEMLANVGLPQWNLNPHEKNELTKSLAHILEQQFPGGLSGRYAPYLRLITVAGLVCVTRYQEHGRLPGFGAKLIEKPKTETAPAE